MNLEIFKNSIKAKRPPAGISKLLEALWIEANGDWDRAHRIVQEMWNSDAAWVHAYLHRKEGDMFNASYWYRHANRTTPDTDFDSEWDSIVEMLLSDYGNSIDWSE